MKHIWAKNMTLFVVIVLMISGCTIRLVPIPEPTPETLRSRNLKPSPGKALVYFLCDFWYLNGTTEVSLDEILTEIKKDTYVLWEVSPGEHQLEFKFIRGENPPETVKATIQCESDQVYYYDQYTEVGGDGESEEKIGRVKAKTAQKKIQNFQVINWFKDGVSVIKKEE